MPSSVAVVKVKVKVMVKVKVKVHAMHQVSERTCSHGHG
jgi:hypothetical protein